MAMPVPHQDYWTAADLDDLPEDGLRYEVLNGQLVVNAAPKPRHQLLIQHLVRVLVDAAPTDLLVLDGVGVIIGDDEPIPDAMVSPAWSTWMPEASRWRRLAWSWKSSRSRQP